MSFILATPKYQPYYKPYNDPLYIDMNSNHPLNIIKNLPDSISLRLFNYHLIKRSLLNSKNLYNHALSKRVFKDIWVQKEGEQGFVAAMGSFDGAEIRKLLGLFILHVLINLETEGRPRAKNMRKVVVDIVKGSVTKPI